MSVSFKAVTTKLNQRIERLDVAFERYFFDLDNRKCVDKYAFQEGLISALWQTWCIYCKDIFFGSIRGGITMSGTPIDTPHFSGLSDYELFYVAKILSENIPLNQIKQAKPQNEPTWGDVNKLSLVFTLANTPNAGYVSSPLASSVLLKDLQMVRNASAHITAHTIQNVISAKVRYSDTYFKHPSDTLLWVDQNSGDYLWKAWIDEIKLLSSIISN